jgi:hypothetical protein
VLPDGSVIAGQTTFAINGTKRTSANVSLMAEVQRFKKVRDGQYTKQLEEGRASNHRFRNFFQGDQVCAHLC